MNLKFNNLVFQKFPIQESERLIFRKFDKKDAPRLYQIRSNPKVMEYMDNISLKSIEEAKFLIKSFKYDFKQQKGISWAITDKQTNLLIGSFAFWRMVKQHCRAEIGYSLLPEYWGKGFMTETFETLIEFGFGKMHLHSIEANVNPQNQNSIKMLERIGFKKEAYFRENYFYLDKFIDSVIYSLLETDQRNYG